MAPKTLLEAVKRFGNYEACKDFMVAMRWPDGKIACPRCGSEHVTFLAKARVWKCYARHPQPTFTLKTGTIFEDSPIALEKWLPVVWLLVNCKNGISSYEVHRGIGVTQKSAWFMLQRVRLALQNGSLMKLGGGGTAVEVDETFIGGKARFMHKSRRIRVLGSDATAHFMGKIAVQGLLERHGELRVRVVGNAKNANLQQGVREHVAPGATVYSDEATAYDKLNADGYQHQVIRHAEKHVDGKVHTNGIEHFWSLLKRGLGGTYISVEPFHLFRYVDEQAFRYNNRKDLNDSDRFEIAMSQIVGKRLTFAEVTGNGCQTAIN